MTKFYIIISILYVISFSSLGADELSITLAKIRNNRFYFATFPTDTNDDTKKYWIPFCILLRNDGKKKIGIFQEDNSFGYDSLTLEVKKENRIIKIIKKTKVWYRNLPTWSTLLPNETLIMPIAVNPQVWENILILKEKNIQIRVVFSQRDTPEEEKIFQIDFYKKYSDFVFKGTIKSQWYSLKIEKATVTELIPVKTQPRAVSF